MSSFQLAFIGFGTVAFFTVTGDLTLTARVASFVAAAIWVIDTTRQKPGPAWPDENDRKWAVRSTLFFAAIIAGNILVGSEGYLMFVMLIFLLGPVLTFIRAVVEATRPAEETA